MEQNTLIFSKKYKNKQEEKFNIEVKEIGEKTKKIIDSVNSEIDNEIKGEFSKSVQDTVSKENQKWQRLV